jgi:hypothetical protein
MKKEIRLLCLANSEKHGGRCIAGVDIDTGEWIRPVSDREDGRLIGEQYTTQQGECIKPVEVLKVRVESYESRSHQPENHRLVDDGWEKIHDISYNRIGETLHSALYQKSPLFGNERPVIPVDQFEQLDIDESLALIEPEYVKFFGDQRSLQIKPKVRIRYRGSEYRLSVTDPECRQRIDRVGEFSHDEYVPEGCRIFLTVSLGTEYKNGYYKVVAGAIKIPDSLLPDEPSVPSGER